MKIPTLSRDPHDPTVFVMEGKKFGIGGDPAMASAFAEYVIRACNTHGELLSALKVAKTYQSVEYERTMTSYNGEQQAKVKQDWETVTAALSKAESR